MSATVTVRGVDVHVGDCRASMRAMPEASVHCCVTSPPYWGLRDYGVEGQLGLEKTPEEYVAGMVDVFREVRRVLRDDGTLWVNLGDSYASSPSGKCSGDAMQKSTLGGGKDTGRRSHEDTTKLDRSTRLPSKSLLGIPWRVAFALQADGWILRAEIVWAKANPMPESVRDRPTRAHEQVFLFAKRGAYFYDAEAVAEASGDRDGGGFVGRQGGADYHTQSGGAGTATRWQPGGTRNLRSVWTLSSEPYPGAHFATFPTEIPRRAIRAGTSEHGRCPACGAPWVRRAGWSPSCRCDDGAPIPCTVLDPFGGSGTTGAVAISEGRRAVLCELSPKYLPLIRRRLTDAPGYTPPLPCVQAPRVEDGQCSLPLVAGGVP